MAPQNQNTKLLKEVAREQLEHASSISNLENKVDDLETGIQRILFLLDNDNNTGSKGLVEKVRTIDSRTRKLESFKENFQGKVTMLGIMGGAISGGLLWIMKLIFKT